MGGDRRAWADAMEEHEAVLRAYVARANAVPDERWTTPLAAGKWSAAEEALHLVLAYEQGLPAAIDGGGMRLVSSPITAWFARTLYLPIMLRARTFPRNAPAPREVRPKAAAAGAISKNQLVSRLEATAGTAAIALRDAAHRTPGLRVMHAYFGALSPLTALRLLNAHTRHHTGLPPRHAA